MSPWKSYITVVFIGRPKDVNMVLKLNTDIYMQRVNRFNNTN